MQKEWWREIRGIPALLLLLHLLPLMFSHWSGLYIISYVRISFLVDVRFWLACRGDVWVEQHASSKTVKCSFYGLYWNGGKVVNRITFYFIFEELLSDQIKSYGFWARQYSIYMPCSLFRGFVNCCYGKYSSKIKIFHYISRLPWDGLDGLYVDDILYSESWSFQKNTANCCFNSLHHFLRSSLLVRPNKFTILKLSRQLFRQLILFPLPFLFLSPTLPHNMSFCLLLCFTLD